MMKKLLYMIALLGSMTPNAFSQTCTDPVDLNVHAHGSYFIRVDFTSCDNDVRSPIVIYPGQKRTVKVERNSEVRVEASIVIPSIDLTKNVVLQSVGSGLNIDCGKTLLNTTCTCNESPCQTSGE